MTPFGIVIPVHGRAELLPRSMSSIAGQRFEGELHAVVAVNDGEQATLAKACELARSVRAPGHRCTVIDTVAGRAAAFNAAERLLPCGPRLYLDHDAVLSARGVAALAAALRPGSGVHFAAPELRIAPSPSAVTRAYYRVWTELPYVRRSPATFGAYAVSAEGRRRWDAFPPIHSDDKFVRLHFAPTERAVVDASYEVPAPAGAHALLRARRRYTRGNRELSKSGTLPKDAVDVPRARGVMLCLAKRKESALFLAVYAAATAVELCSSLIGHDR